MLVFWFGDGATFLRMRLLTGPVNLVLRDAQ